jgi:anti-sigma regulatory factor (Ser/Thr protein kinase)
MNEHAFTSEPEQLAGARRFAAACLEGAGFDGDAVALAVLAVDEACANVIRHAYRGEPGRPILLRWEEGEEHVRFILKDTAPPPDPARVAPCEIAPDSPGGLGLHLIRRIFDSVEFRGCEGGTELVLEKRRPGR